MEKYQVEVNVLGLRNLESSGLMPVTKPFIKFGIKGLLPPDRSAVVNNIET
jgi:hypothetical protein